MDTIQEAQGRRHAYAVQVKWTGNRGNGTSNYASYDRAHEVSAAGKAPILASSDAAFRGDRTKYNPEDLLVASLSSCHMLWYLHLCTDARVIVTEYTDAAEGTMIENPDGSGQFVDVVLRPHVVIERGDPSVAMALHDQAHDLCFIARSVNFDVRCEPQVRQRRE